MSSYYNVPFYSQAIKHKYVNTKQCGWRCSKIHSFYSQNYFKHIFLKKPYQIRHQLHKHMQKHIVKRKKAIFIHKLKTHQLTNGQTASYTTNCVNRVSLGVSGHWGNKTKTRNISIHTHSYTHTNTFVLFNILLSFLSHLNVSPQTHAIDLLHQPCQKQMAAVQNHLSWSH